eukprot:CAMPEP_0194148440 /NCGR_PEP_ID=MMETSP0152-20130528/32449_1 /TAXON_ID=1049557 /ORGANISM="Thalassiothrix antarctica, Strain L6-D1" /LENGTH=81 /DNA_ID=CAMNT_0038849999 /DNA_START=220 /DNA_END=465 /DNA_ORIENTATION=+
MNMAKDGSTLKAVIDSREGRPFPFTTKGVRKAFRLQETRHIHGKVVIQVNNNNNNNSSSTDDDDNKKNSSTDDHESKEYKC